MLSKIFSKDYFKERSLLVLTGLAIVLALFTVLRVIMSVKQYDFKIATGYTQYGADSFIQGEWYSIYEFAAFAILTTVMMVFISARVFKIDRTLAYIVVILQQVVLVFLLIISGAILGASTIAT